MNEVTPKSLNYSTFLQPYYSQCTYFAISDITFQGNTIHSRWSRSTCDRLVKVALYKWMHLYNNGPWLEMKTIIGTEDKERKSQIIITAPPKHYLSHSTPLIGEGKILMVLAGKLMSFKPCRDRFFGLHLGPWHVCILRASLRWRS